MPSSGTRGVCLVDGYNVIYKIPFLARLLKSNQDHEAREQLRELCLRFSLRQRMRVLLVFDGSRALGMRAPRSDANVEIIFAIQNEKADGWIRDRAERLYLEKQSVLVVTEDRGIKGRLPARVRTITPRTFWSMIEPTSKAEPNEKPAPPLEDVEAYFLDAERRMKEEVRRKKEEVRKKK